MATSQESMPKAVTVAAVAGTLVFGAGSTLAMKLQYALYSRGSTGEEKLFDKSFFITFLMFLGMTAVLAPYYTFKHRGDERIADGGANEKASENTNKNTSNDVSENTSKAASKCAAIMYIGIPAMLELVCMSLLFHSLLFIPASIYSMLRGSLVVFTAVFSVLFLGRKLYCFHWIGVLLCTMGIIAAGLANMLNSGLNQASGDRSTASERPILGMSLVIIAAVVQACQFLVEEKLLKDVKIPPMEIVGYQGVWGTAVFIVAIFPACMLIPGSDNGHLEDVLDTTHMLKNSGALFAAACVYIFVIAGYNVSAMSVTCHLSAVHRTMVEASRTLVIWVVGLGVHYFINSDIAFGEALTVYSPLQLLGFLLLLTGQLLYGGVLKMPCTSSRSDSEAAAEDKETRERSGLSDHAV